MTHPSQNTLVGRAVAGRFTITRLLGEGGMATVYAAEQEAEPREVALKIMNDSRAADRGFMKRFQREAKAAARVKHANSVRILDYGVTDDGLSYIAMELVRGDNLYTLLEREGALSEQRAARILAEVCDVLAEAHALGIVHRDLKPENIMLIADPAHPNGERVKVLDFGIAKIMEPEVKPVPKVSGESGPDSGVTRAGTLLGTPAYMSPEQCALEAVDTRADLYTCGVLLFQLITGALPFEGQTPLHTASMHIHRPPPKPSELAPKIDPRLEAIILKALAKKPAERFQGARLFAAALRKILPEVGNAVVALAPPSKRPSQRSPHASNQQDAPSRAPATAFPMADAQGAMDRSRGSEEVSLSRGDQEEAAPRVVLQTDAYPVAGFDADGPTRIHSSEAFDALRAEEAARRMSDDSELTLVRSEQSLRRYGPQHTEVIEVGDMLAWDASSQGSGNLGESSGIRPAAGMPARASERGLSAIIAPPIPPMSAEMAGMGVSPLRSPPPPMFAPGGSTITDFPRASPAPGVAIALPFVAPRDPHAHHARASLHPLTRGILLGFVASVVVVGLLMTGVVLLVGR